MSDNIGIFLLEATAVSLSGVMAPGPVTAATIAAGSRSRHAGAAMAVGHGVVEFPLMLLIMAGVRVLFDSPAARIAVGLAGGAFLILMSLQMLLGSARDPDAAGPAQAIRPLWTGVVLTGGNPYFLLWWAMVGLTLATRALALGPIAFALFAIVHWLCDLAWLEVLSLASFKGAKILGGRRQRIVLVLCAAAMLAFGGLFLFNAARQWLAPAGGVKHPPAARGYPPLAGRDREVILTPGAAACPAPSTPRGGLPRLEMPAAAR